MLYNIVDTRDIAECARLSAESSVSKNGSRYLMVSCAPPLPPSACLSVTPHFLSLRRTRGTGELHVPEIQSILQGIYTGCDVAGPEEGKSRGALADTKAAREELGMDFHSVEDTLRATIDSTIGAHSACGGLFSPGCVFTAVALFVAELGFIQPNGPIHHRLFRWHDRLQPLLVDSLPKL